MRSTLDFSNTCQIGKASSQQRVESGRLPSYSYFLVPAFLRASPTTDLVARTGGFRCRVLPVA